MQRQTIPKPSKGGPDLRGSTTGNESSNDSATNDKSNDNVVQANRVGRRSKSPEEKESKLVGLMLTPEEYNNLNERAGLAPAAAVLKDHLRRETDLFKPVKQAS